MLRRARPAGNVLARTLGVGVRGARGVVGAGTLGAPPPAARPRPRQAPPHGPPPRFLLFHFRFRRSAGRCRRSRMDNPDCDSTWEEDEEDGEGLSAEDDEDGEADAPGDADAEDEDKEEARPSALQVQPPRPARPRAPRPARPRRPGEACAASAEWRRGAAPGITVPSPPLPLPPWAGRRHLLETRLGAQPPSQAVALFPSSWRPSDASLDVLLELPTSGPLRGPCVEIRATLRPVFPGLNFPGDISSRGCPGYMLLSVTFPSRPGALPFKSPSSALTTSTAAASVLASWNPAGDTLPAPYPPKTPSHSGPSSTTPLPLLTRCSTHPGGATSGFWRSLLVVTCYHWLFSITTGYFCYPWLLIITATFVATGLWS